MCPDPSHVAIIYYRELYEVYTAFLNTTAQKARGHYQKFCMDSTNNNNIGVIQRTRSF